MRIITKTFRNIENRVLNDKSLFIFISIIFLFRLIYVLFVIDPHSGQDAPSFSADAISIIQNGPFSSLEYAPWWPVGYSWFVALWWGIFGIDSRFLGVAQTSLLLLAQILAIIMVRRLFDTKSSQVFGYLIMINFALFSSSGQLMYEVPLASFLILGAFNLISLLKNGVWNFKSAALSGICFSLAILMHPSGLAPALVLLLVAIWGNRLTKRLIIQIAISLTLLSTGVFSQMARNYVAGDGLGFSTTTFSNAQLGGWGTNDQKRASECEKIGKQLSGKRNQNRWDNPERQVCLYVTTLKDPPKILEIVRFNTQRYWSPFVGILKGGGTWYHGLDWRRFVTPWYHWWEGWAKIVDTTLGYIWFISHFTLAVFGVFEIKRRRMAIEIQSRKFAPFLLLPVVTTYLISVLTLGDTRHRMPTMIFYEVVVAFGLINIARRIKKISLLKVQP